MSEELSISYLPVDKIIPSPYQYRKSFGGAEDDELAASVKKHGVLQPLRVRPNGKPGTFELVFGERRLRAAKQVGLDTVPALVVDLTDDQAIEQLLIENLKRKDVHPIEEGEGYWALMHKHGYTEEQLLAKTGRSRVYIYGRIKLAKQLAPGPRKAVLDGRLPVSHAEIIARIGDVKLQEQCTKEVLGGKLDYDTASELEEVGIMHEQLEEEGAHSYGRGSDASSPLSFDATRALIRRRYTTKLAIAKFDPADATLVQKVGACTTCVHRSSNQPELPGLAPAKKTDADVCLNPPCYADKNKAMWKRVAGDAEKRGLEIVDEPKGVFAYDGIAIANHSPYVELDAELPGDLQKTPNGKATWKGLLGSHAGEVKRVLVQDESGAPRELLDKASTVKLLREHKKLDPPAKKSSSSSSSSAGSDWKKNEAKRKADQAVIDDALVRTLEQIAKGATSDPGKKELAMWRWIARLVMRDGWDMDLMAKRRGFDDNAKGFAGAIDKAKTVGDVRSLLIEGLAAQAGQGGTGSYSSKTDKDNFEEACKLFGGDWDKSLEAAKAAAKVEAKADAAKDAKKKPAKKGAKKK